MAIATTTGRLLAGAALAALLSACQTVREQEVAVRPEVAHTYLADKPEALRKHFYVSLTQGKRNQVLNDMRLGLAALEAGHDLLARELFDDALLNIESIYADNEAAAQARQLFVKEAVKDFKGEPYERAMAYFYRGLLYLREGDYDNARASFKGGLLQDSFAEEDQNRADFALLAYLQGWASRCRGNTATAEEDFKEFRAINDSFPLPGPDDNVLVLVETGSAPVKYSAADENSSVPRYLKVRRASATETARIQLGEPVGGPPGKARALPPRAETRSAELSLLEDVFRQASTRGGRAFDAILDGKAQFKEGVDTVGNVMVLGGAAALAVAAERSEQGETTEADGAVAVVGLGMVVAGLIAKGVAEAAEAEADIRYWDNLPDRVHGLPVALPAGVGSLSVEFMATDGSVVRTREAAVTRAGSCGLAWVRGKSALPGSPRAPYSAPSDTMAAPVVIPALPAAPTKSVPVKAEDAATPGDKANPSDDTRI